MQQGYNLNGMTSFAPFKLRHKFKADFSHILRESNMVVLRKVLTNHSMAEFKGLLNLGWAVTIFRLNRYIKIIQLCSTVFMKARMYGHMSAHCSESTLAQEPPPQPFQWNPRQASWQVDLLSTSPDEVTATDSWPVKKIWLTYWNIRDVSRQMHTYNK